MFSDLVKQLGQRIREMEASEHSVGAPIPLEIPAFEDAFPARSLPAGSLVELLAGDEGAAIWTLALLLGKQAYGERKTLVIVDEQRRFYPPAAFRLGIDLPRTLVIRARQRAQVFAALVQSLRCAAVGAAIGYFDRLSPADSRCLQLAAETGGGLGLLCRPASALREPSFAAARLLVAPLPSTAARRRIQIEVARIRGGKAGQLFSLEIDDETGHVCLPASVADPATEA